jgi:hypothetical protein
MVGSWLQSSSKRLNDSSLWAFNDRAGERTEEDANEAKEPVLDRNLLKLE